MSATQTDPAAPQGSGARRRGLTLLAIVVLIGVLAYGIWWWLAGQGYEGTDDAYVNGDVVQITSEVPGTVLAIHADDTQAVKAGDALIDLDPADANIAMANAEADLGRAVRQVRALFSQGDQLRAQIAERKLALDTAQQDLKRRQSLMGDGAVSGEELAHARDNVASLKAALEAAQQQLGQTTAQVDGTTIASNPAVLAAAAAVRNAALALHRTHIVAPTDGVVAKRVVQTGQRVAPGTPLMAVVPLNDVWVEANFKEVQLSRMRAGQPVDVTSDLYGSDVTYHGKVVGMSAGSGTAFSLLPAQNASGNWIKIVQRLPVRILLDPQELQQHPLRIGLSMTVKVDVHDTSGPLVADSVRNVPLPQQASDANDAEVEALIRKIIDDNAGAAAKSGGKAAAAATSRHLAHAMAAASLS